MNRVRSLISTIIIGSFFASSGLLSTPDKTHAAPMDRRVAVNPGDSPCYMQTSDGRMLNLSKLCQGGDRNPGLSAADRAFLARYQDYLRTRLGRLPQTQTALTQAQQNPQALIQRARNACASMQNGGSKLVFASQAQVDAKVVNDLALNYYCPNLQD